MLNINVKEMKSIINKIDTFNNNYEEIIMNLFKLLEETSLSWEDNKAYEFRNRIYYDKNETYKLLNLLRKYNNLNSFLCEKYENIGNNIVYDINSKDKLLKELDDNYKYSISITKDFDKIDKNIIYPEGRSLLTQKEKIIAVSKKLEEIKSSFILECKKIEDIEDYFNIKLKDLEEITIEEFYLEHNYNTDKSLIGNLEQFEKNIKIISSYIDEESTTLKEIYKLMSYFENKYGDKNKLLIINNINKLEDNIKRIYTKRMAYVNLLNSILDKYTNIEKMTNKRINEMEDSI